MGLSNLSRIYAHRDPNDPNGLTVIADVVGDWEPESLRLAQLAVKLSAMRSHGERQPPYKIEIESSREDPPEAAVGLVHRVGGAVIRAEDRQPTAGRPGMFHVNADGDLDWAAIQAANAALFARQHGLDGTVDSLRQVDALLTDAFVAAGGHPEEICDVPVDDGDLAILAGAYASEVILNAFGGVWAPPDEDSHLPSFRILLRPDGSLDVGAAEKVRKFLRNGPSDSVHGLAEAVADYL